MATSASQPPRRHPARHHLRPPFRTIEPLAATSDPRCFPTNRCWPEIAVAGRSNVGKSSLINALFPQQRLARVAARPGTTQRLHFFAVDQQLLLVDLPGYGYAKASWQRRIAWSDGVEAYFARRPLLALLLLLIDMRRCSTAADLSLIHLLLQKELPVILVLSKSDQLPKCQVPAALASAKQELSQLFRAPIACLAYARNDRLALKNLRHTMQRCLISRCAKRLSSAST